MATNDMLTVLNPVGFPPKVTRKQLAPRLDTLEGKTVYLVDCRFDDSDVFLEQMQAWFAEHMPGVRTSSSPSRASISRRPDHLAGDQGEGPRRHRRRRPLKHLRAGGRRARDDDREPQYGVPTVAMHTDKFDRVVRSVAAVNGMPGLRQVFVPQPIMGKTAAELRAYIDGRIRSPAARSCRR